MPTAREIRRDRDNANRIGTMLRIGEASKILGVHGNTLRRWSDQGIITAYRIGSRGDRRFRREDVDVLLVEATQHSQKGMHID